MFYSNFSLKNILLVVLAICLLLVNIGILIFRKENIYLKEQLIYKESLLDIFIDQSIEGFKTEMEKMKDSVVIYSILGEKKFFKDILDTENLLFFCYNENSCSDCVDFVIPYIKKLSSEIGSNKIVILASYEENRHLNIFKQKNHLKNNIYNLKGNKLGLYLDKKNIPYLFMMDKNGLTKLVFIPHKTFPAYTEKYFELVKLKLVKKKQLLN